MAAKKIRYGVLGGGFRAAFYLRIALEAPDLFEVCGQVTHYPEKTAKYRGLLGVRLYDSAAALVQAEAPDFLVVSIRRPREPENDPMIDLVKLDIPLLMETPAAFTVEGLDRIYEICRGKKVQVAEQLHAQAEIAAVIAVANSGILGSVTQVDAAFHHTYHCLNVVRKILNLTFENAEIRAKRYCFPVVQGYTRGGIAETEQLVTETRDFALLDFNGKLVNYNYENNQIRAFVRSPHICVRGERGEIHDRTVRWLAGHKDLRMYTWERLYGGAQSNMEPLHFRGLMGEGRWLYLNLYPYTRLSDEEIAVATITEKMAAYVEEGKSFCSMAEACQDQYLSLMIEKSAVEGKPLVTETRIWAE
ncbi:MAG: Gfo/Idh/MocA family oxidoreductase [Treponema sp.]|jgi:hypothetical protein|nr:Gfo/Idh/MocA family oxidoreductase [Treponema sp.]